MNRKTTLTLSITAMWMLAATTGLALGSGAGAVSLTQNFIDSTQTFPVPSLCGSGNGTLTFTFNAVFHVTFLTSGVGAGTGWGTFTQTGTFVFTPFDPTLPTFTGMLTGWDGFNFNLNNFAFTSIFVVHATGSDGSTLTFHDAMHITILNPLSSNPNIVVSFDKPSCG
jgi:hypothetical protein